MPLQTTKPLRKILYASYQTGESLPGYVRYALEGLCRTGFSVVYLTNERDLDAASHAFLDANRIELFFTENRGYDFGMWKRYIQYTAKFRREEWERLVLINDSVVYFQNRFRTFFDAAEENSADVVSLTENDEIAPHLQSFFLYMKRAAVAPFCRWLLAEPEGKDFYDTVRRLEVGTSEFLRGQGFSLAALFHTSKPILFSYPELIRNRCGFVKRKLLEKRWTRQEVFHFWRNGAGDALALNYVGKIRKEGFPDRDFKPEWLSLFDKTLSGKIGECFRFAYCRIRWELSKIAVRIKSRIRGRRR